MAKDEVFKPSGKLKDFVSAGKAPSRVLTSVERYYIVHPEISTRRTDVLHPSAMVKDDWCHRASYFHLLGFPPAEQRVSLSLKRVFQNGHAIHDAWQTMFKEMGNLWGKYYCKECNDTFFGLPSDHKTDVSNLQYEEVPLVYEPLHIDGHADGILLNFGEPLLLEIKSIGAGTFRYEAPGMMYDHNGDLEKMWKALEAPFMSHIKQAQVYMKIAELSGLAQQPQEALFLYENKASQQAKEFVVPKSDFGISHIIEGAQLVSDAFDNKTPPTCNIAPTEGCKQCKGYDNVQA